MKKANAIKRFIATKVIFFSLMGTVANEVDKTIVRPASYNAPQTLSQIVKSEPKTQYFPITQEIPIQQTEPTKEAQERLRSINIGTYFPIWYKIGDLGYADSEDAYLIPMDWIMSHTIKDNDTIDKYWEMEGQEPAKKDLKQRIILTINLPVLYPKGFSTNFNLNEKDIVLPKGKKVNFVDRNHDGFILGERGEYVAKEDALKITDLKNNYGELMLNGSNR